MTEGWEQKPLSEICVFQRGLTYAKSDEVDSPGHTVLRANNIDLTSHELDFNELKFISDSVAVPASKIVRPGSLLVCTASGSKTHLGKVAYIDSDYGYAYGGFMGQLTPSKGVDGRYLFHVLISPGYKDFIEGLSDGVNINNLKFDDLGRFPVPLPPLPEQRRIVAILDEAFEAIATAKANTEKNLQNAREVFEANLEAAFCHQGPDWKQAKLQDICTLYNGRAYNKDELLSAGKYPVLRVGNFFTNKHWYYSDLELDEHKYCDSGDLLYAWSASFGPRIWDGGKVIFHYHIWKVVPRADCVEKEYLKYLLEWDTEKIKAAQGTGTTMMHVGKGSMEARVVPVPPLPVQRRIVTQLDALNQEVELLSDLLSRKLAALDELKRSLLHQAFTGQLTAKSTDQQLEAVA